MPILAQLRCNNCGHRFEEEILSRDEKQEKENQPSYPIQCPKCNRTDVRTGWD